MIIYDDSWIKDRRRATVFPQHGTAAKIENGKPLFDTPSILSQSTVGNAPPQLVGENIIFKDGFQGLGMRVEEDGWVLLIVEREPEVATPANVTFYLNHQMGGIFKKVADFEDGELLPNWQTPLSVFGAFCKKGMDFQSAIISEALTIVIADIDPSYAPISPAQAEAENIRLSYLPPFALTKEELEADAEYYRPANRGYQGVPTITSKNGVLFAAHMADPIGKTFCSGENYYGYIPVLRSFDGINWENPLSVFDPDKDGPRRLFDPMLWFDEDRLYLSFVQQVGCTSNLSGYIALWITYCDNPFDESPIWSEPRMLFPGTTAQPPQKLSDGKWYWATYFYGHFQKQYYDEECLALGTGTRLYKSDNLFDWELISTFDPTNRAIVEPCIIEYEKGKILMVERTNTNSRICYTTLDNPKNWENVHPLRYDNNDEESPIMQYTSSRNNLLTLKSGNILLLFHDSEKGLRNNICAALSEDGGVTWPYKIMLDERLHSSYPMATQCDDGSVIIIYDQGRGRSAISGSGELLCCRITEEDIKAGKCVTPVSVLKRLISRYEEAPREPSLNEQLLAAERIIAANPAAKESIEKAISVAKENYTLENYLALCEICDSFSK